MPVQQRLLLIFVRYPQQILSRQFLQQQLWSPPLQQPPNSAKALTLAVHRLRQTFAGGPLGMEVITAVYGKGYCLDLPVHPVVPSSPEAGLSLTATGTAGSHPTQAPNLAQLYYLEANDHWPRRDPYDLDRRLWLLQQSLAHEPAFMDACFDLCYFSLLQCLWGVRSVAEALPQIQECLARAGSLPNLSPVWSAIHAEVMTMLLWQPRISMRRYGLWLARSLPAGLPLYSWSRHLIFAGHPRQAVRVLKAMVRQDLRQGWLVLSLAYAALGNLETAIEAADHQLRIDASLVGSRLFLAMLVALRGNGESALRIVTSTGILDRPFQGSLALVCYSLAHGSMRSRAHLLLDEALTVIKHEPAKAGGIGYWGLAALALGRSMDAFYLLPLSVQHRCYSAPVLLAMPFLAPHKREPACLLFHEQMQAHFPLPAAGGKD